MSLDGLSFVCVSVQISSCKDISNTKLGFSSGTVVKNSPAKAGDAGDSIYGSGRSPGVGNCNSLKYSCLENPMDRGAWKATVHGVAKSQT